MAKFGGKQENAGRPKGAVSKRSQEITSKAIEGGITPIEVMVKSMRQYDALAEKEFAKIKDRELDEANSTSFAAATGLRQKAVEFAKDAAAYIHPKLNAISAPNGGPIQIGLEIKFV